ncbi:MAG: GNAT family N-acetyltransferase [Thaumarchaeota archaeon]|nr:GNAT family N-acetyltransferase [Nitrososphaerota archaeon]
MDKSYTTLSKQSERTVLVAEAFGLGLDAERRFQVLNNLQVDLRPGDVCYVVGDSGGGKSTLLRLLQEQIRKAGIFGEVIDEKSLAISEEEILIEGAGDTFEEALSNLCQAGLGDAYLFIRKFSELSDGQRYRYRIAKMFHSGAKVMVFDEFLSTLDRDTAKAVAYCLQKIARRERKTLLVATTHEDLLEDLNPSIAIRKEFGSAARIEYRNPTPALKHRCSLTEGITITESGREAYEQLSEFHYRAGLPSTTRKIFAMQRNGRIIGIIAYSASPLASSGRSKFLGYAPSSVEVNRDFLRISRVVIHPKYRSLGLGARLVRETLPLCRSRHVETFAVMARFNPFFEHGGMTRVEYESDSVQQARAILQRVGVDFRSVNQLSDKEYGRVVEELAKARPHFALASVYGHEHKLSKEGLLKDLQDRSFTKRVLAELAIESEEKAYFIWRNSAL